jgi:hypothetical protein
VPASLALCPPLDGCQLAKRRAAGAISCSLETKVSLGHGYDLGEPDAHSAIVGRTTTLTEMPERRSTA